MCSHICPRLSAPLTPQPHCNPLPIALYFLITHCLPFPVVVPVSHLIWLPENVDYITPSSQAPAQLNRLSKVWVTPEKIQQLGSCICSYSAAQTPQGRHPGH